MNKLLKTLAGMASPRFHAAAPALGSAHFGAAATAQVLGVSRSLAALWAALRPRMSISFESTRAADWRSLHDEDTRRADARMTQVMVETRLF